MARRLFAVLVLALLAAVALVYVGFSPDTQAEVTVRDGGNQTTHDGTTTQNASDEGNASVQVADDGGQTLGNVSVRIADDPQERYTGLSETESLGPNEGMLFVYAQAGERTYVMRSMDFPIDIVFVDANGTITEIYHAPVEADNQNLTEYTGYGKWVLEVPYNWTVEHNVTVGDRIAVER
ncbi:DUF192 domain-containing protein [Halobacterium wangiae]|uniref:DUF192 domain-containing protein n=1 Tax=Halobacterium wangiae TaxID=2902623 RepID=UPI001E4E8FEF|nr:DUF192 domain-containing protein [Halobacterium wangiae]